MGGKPVYPEERTQRQARTDGFWMLSHEVTVGEFARFVAETNYQTTAERALSPAENPGVDPSLLEPGGAYFGPNDSLSNDWRYVAGASWRSPDGSSTVTDERLNEPVTQVSLEDARAYAAWLGHELPTEDEWEYASMGGARGQMYPWGESLTVHGEPQANYWQGLFPTQNTALDGYEGVAPVGCFSPNDYGLYDMIGNVWELVLTDYSPDRDAPRASARSAATIKGGSFLCAENFCGRFRPAARQPQERDLTTNHVGFRTIYRSPPPDSVASADMP